jgi:hypothetical protein
MDNVDAKHIADLTKMRREKICQQNNEGICLKEGGKSEKPLTIYHPVE